MTDSWIAKSSFRIVVEELSSAPAARKEPKNSGLNLLTLNVGMWI
jgi:hypothetical protein